MELTLLTAFRISSGTVIKSGVFLSELAFIRRRNEKGCVFFSNKKEKSEDGFL